MALCSCFIGCQISPKMDYSRLPCMSLSKNKMNQRLAVALPMTFSVAMVGQQDVGKKMNQFIFWSSLRGSRIDVRHTLNVGRNFTWRRRRFISATWLPCSQIASSAFTLGTVAVLPFYTIMVVAPRAELTKKVAASSVPYIVLGMLYAYLLYLSWTPDTIRLMFASKYWLPELTGIAKMFSSEMTLASAWIHLLAVDLFAARQVYYDGMANRVEMRHSISLCLLFCPLGILVHFITKALTRSREEAKEHDVRGTISSR